jgi:hypothetical protein
MRKFLRLMALVAVISTVSGLHNEADARKTWRWVLFISFCEVACDPVLDPGGSEYCDCFR